MTSLRPEHGTSTNASRSSETRFVQLAESGIVGMCIGNVHGDIFEVNDAFLGLIGFNRNEFDAGEVKWVERTPPEWTAVHRSALDALKRSGVAPPHESALLHKDGRRVPVIIGAATLDYPNTVAIVTDLTSFRRGEHTTLRAERRLQHAQKMEALAGLAGGMAHEFNNLLSVILGYTGMLAADLAANDPMLDLLDEIRTAGERAAGLTRQLLAFSRHQLLRAEVVDLSETVTAVRDEVKHVVGDAVEVVVSSAASLPRIRSEADHLREAILQLAANARDAMPAGGTLRIEAASVTIPNDPAENHVDLAPGEYVVLAVADSGAGMDRATHSRMFEPFFTTKGVGEGTGLGLAGVFGVVQRSGGSIRVESELGKGTTLRLYFPAAASGEVRTTEDMPGRASHEGTETILIVDDEVAVRSAAAGALRQNGYTVLEAADGAEALLVCRSHDGRVDLLLTHVVLSRAAEREFLEKLRAMNERLAVLYMSEYTAASLVRHGVIGADAAFLQKPFSEATVSRAVRRALDMAATARATNG